MIIRELCLENFTKVPQALQAGIERIELCDNLAVGGTTPSYGVIQEAAEYVAESKTTLAVMIRPRGGNFVYNSHELKIIGYDGTHFVENYYPYLTTIRQPIKDIAHLLVDVLLKKIDHQDIPKDYILPVGLLSGESV